MFVKGVDDMEGMEVTGYGVFVNIAGRGMSTKCPKSH